MIIEEENRPYTRGKSVNFCKCCDNVFYTLPDEEDDQCFPCHMVEVEKEEGK